MFELPRNPWGGIDWSSLKTYLQARWRDRASSAESKQMRAESDRWRRKWEDAGCPPVGHPDCPPTHIDIRNRRYSG